MCLWHPLPYEIEEKDRILSILFTTEHPVPRIVVAPSNYGSQIFVIWTHRRQQRRKAVMQFDVMNFKKRCEVTDWDERKMFWEWQ